MAEGPGPELDPGILSSFGQPNIDPDIELSQDVEPSENAIPNLTPTANTPQENFPTAAAQPRLDPSTFETPAPTRTYMVPGAQPQGLLAPGNTEILDRPKLQNPDGSFSTTSSMSFEDESGREVLIPTVVNGQRLSKDEAIRAYYATGNHLGIFRDAADADAYAQTLHNFQVTAGGGKLSDFDKPENQRRQAQRLDALNAQVAAGERAAGPRAPLDPKTFETPRAPLDPKTFETPTSHWWEGFATGFTRIATEQGLPGELAPALHVGQTALDMQKLAVAGERELGVPDSLALYSKTLPGDPAGSLGAAYEMAKGLHRLMQVDPTDPNYHTNLWHGAVSLYQHVTGQPWEATGELAGQMMDPLFWIVPEAKPGTAAAKALKLTETPLTRGLVRAGDIAGRVTEYGGIGAGETFTHATATGQPVTWQDLATDFLMTGGVFALGHELHGLTERAPIPRVEIPPEDADRVLGPLFPPDRGPEAARTPDIDIQPHRDGFTVGGVNQPEANRKLLATREEAERWQRELQIRAAIHQVIPFAPPGSGPMPHLQNLLVNIFTQDNIKRNDWIRYWHEALREPLGKAAGRAAARAAIAGTIAYGFGGYPSAVMFALIGGAPGLAAWRWPDKRINAAGLFNTYAGRQAVWSRATQVFHRWIVNMVPTDQRRNVISMAMEGGENFEPQLGERDVRLYSLNEQGNSVDGTPFHWYTLDRREAEAKAREQGRDYLEALDYPKVMDTPGLNQTGNKYRMPIPIEEHWRRMGGFRADVDPIKTQLNPEEQEVARQVREFYDMMGQAGMDADVLKGLVRNYVSHVWEQDPETMGRARRGALEQTVQNIIDIATLAPGDVPPHAPGAGVSATQFAKPRRYPNLMELLRALKGSNIRIKTGDIAEIMSIYSHSMFGSIEMKRMITALRGWPNEGILPEVVDPRTTMPPEPTVPLIEQQPFEGDWREIQKPQLLPPGGPFVPKDSTEPPPPAWGHTRLYALRPEANYFRDKLHVFLNDLPQVMRGEPVYFIDVTNDELQRWTRDDAHQIYGNRYHRPHWQLPPFQAFRPYQPEPPLEVGFRRLYAMEPGGTVATMEQSLQATLANIRTDQANVFAEVINELTTSNLSPRAVSRGFWNNVFPQLPDNVKYEFVQELEQMGEHPDPNESWRARGLNLTWELPDRANQLGLSPYMGYVARMHRVAEKFQQGEPTRWFTTNRHLAQMSADNLHSKDFLEYVDVAHEAANTVRAQGAANMHFYYLPRAMFEHSKQMNWRKPAEVARRKTSPPAPPPGHTRLYAVDAGEGDFTSDEAVGRYGDNIPPERRQEIDDYLTQDLTERYRQISEGQTPNPEMDWDQVRGAWGEDGRFVGYDYKHQGWVEFTPEGTPQRRAFTTDPGITSHTDMPMEYVDVPDSALEYYHRDVLPEDDTGQDFYDLPHNVYEKGTHIPVEGPAISHEPGAVEPRGPRAGPGDYPPVDREAANEPGGWSPPEEPPPGETAQRFAAGEPRHLIEQAPGGPLYEKMPGGFLEGLVVHRDIAPQLRMLYDAKNPHDVMMAINAINMTQKRTIVMLSLFHAMNLYQAWLGAIGARVPGSRWRPQLGERALPITGFFVPKWLGGPQIEEFGKEHGARKAARDAMARYNFGHDPVIDLLLFYGLKIGRPMDVERGEFERMTQLIQRATDTTFPVSATGKAKLVLAEFNRKFDEFTFGELQNGFKLTVALQTFERLMNKGFSQHRAAEIAAQFSNNIFGSLDWFRLSQEVGSKFGRDLAYAFFNPSGKRWMQLMMFAPDWTFSTFRAAYMALPGAVEDKALAALHRRYLIKSTLLYLTLGSALQLVFTGKLIWQNKDPTRVELPDGRTMQFSRHYNEPWEIMQEPIQTLANKLAFWPRMLSEVAYGREWIGHDPKYSPPIHHPGGNYVAEYAKFFLKQFAPIFAQQGFAGGGWWSVPLGTAGFQIYGSTPEQKEQFRRQDKLERFERKKERFEQKRR